MDQVTPPLGLYLAMCKMAIYFSSQKLGAQTALLWQGTQWAGVSEAFWV